MSYVVAGYAVAFATLATYSVWVLRRHRRLERLFGERHPPVTGR